MGAYYPKRFPALWKRIDELATDLVIMSVREVRKEMEITCRSDHIEAWVDAHPHLFPSPTAEECAVVAELFKKEQYRGLVKRDSILKGSPVADPFIIAAAKVNGRCVVTQESFKTGGARIPTACKEPWLNVECISCEGFMEQQGIRF